MLEQERPKGQNSKNEKSTRKVNEPNFSPAVDEDLVSPLKNRANLVKQVNLAVKPGETLDDILGFVPNNLEILETEQMFPSLANDKEFGILSTEEEKLSRIYTIKIGENANSDEVIKFLQESGRIEYAEEDHLYNLNYIPNDPLLDKLYGLKNMGCHKAWDIAQGEGVVVAVVDTGVDYNHPDIKDNMWTNEKGEYGYDFSDKNNNPLDYQGHGSHVAGTIAATGNNAKGIIGVAPKAKVMAVKIFPNAYSSVIAKALRYAVKNGAQVINNSWGPSSRKPIDKTLENICDYVYSKGVVNVFAAGNNNDDVQYYSPANSLKTIAVASTKENDQRSGFSNYGNLIDVAAPGSAILSLRFNTSSYTTMSGTSMASPHVAGLAALILSKKPTLTVEEVKAILKKGCDTIATDKPTGSGRVNAYKSLSLVKTQEKELEEKLINELNSADLQLDFTETVDTQDELFSIQESGEVSLGQTGTMAYRDGSVILGNFTKVIMQFSVTGRINGRATRRIYTLHPKQSIWSQFWDSGSSEILIIRTNHQNASTTVAPFRGLSSWIWYLNC